MTSIFNMYLNVAIFNIVSRYCTYILLRLSRKREDIQLNILYGPDDAPLPPKKAKIYMN